MIEIFLTLFKIFTLFYILGYGVTYFLTPDKLKEYSFWLIPWFSIISIIIFLVIGSQFGLSVKIMTPFLCFLLLTLSIYIFIKKKQIIKLAYPRDYIIGLFIFISIIFNLSPLLIRDKFLTTISLGNNDPVIYAKAGDYLVNHSLKERNNDLIHIDLKNLFNLDYRWGSGILPAFFLNLLKIRGYQLIYLFQVILFSLLTPLVYILFEVLFKKSILGLFFILFLTSFNINLLYILYHNFFGEVLYWGLSMLFLIYFFYHVNYIKRKNLNLIKTEAIIAIILSSVYLSYQEAVFFILAPVFFYIIILFFNKKTIYFYSFIKIFFLCFIFTSNTIIHNLIFNIKTIILSFNKIVDKNIGWPLFRNEFSFPNPIEVFGFYSIHMTNPLNIYVSLIFSIFIIYIYFFGTFKIKNKESILSFIFIYFLIYFKTGIINPNFFDFYRIITYTLPFLITIFVIGLISLFERSKKILFFILLISILLELKWSLILNKQFISNHLSVGKQYVSLSQFKKNKIIETIYSENIIDPNILLWNDIWKRYFLNEDTYINKDKIKKDFLLLLAKNPIYYKKPQLVIKEILWKNDYYELVRICNTDKCLIHSNSDLSNIIFSKSKFEDSLLISGWSIKENDARWTNNKESKLKLINSIYSSKIYFTARSLDKPQSAKVIIDNKIVGLVLFDTKYKDYNLFTNYHIDPGVHVVSFQFSNLYKPSDLFNTTDNRTLAVSFKKIGLK